MNKNDDTGSLDGILNLFEKKRWQISTLIHTKVCLTVKEFIQEIIEYSKQKKTNLRFCINRTKMLSQTPS